MTFPRDSARGDSLHKADHDRRDSQRRPPSSIPGMRSSELAGGQAVRLLNISRGGALLETEAHLIPGEIIRLRLVAADATFLLRGRVVRSRSVLVRDTGLLYQCAIELYGNVPLTMEEHLAGFPAETTLPSSSTEGLPVKGVMRRISEQDPGKETEDSSGILTVTVPFPQTGPDIRQMFGLSNW